MKQKSVTSIDFWSGTSKNRVAGIAISILAERKSTLITVIRPATERISMSVIAFWRTSFGKPMAISGSGALVKQNPVTLTAFMKHAFQNPKPSFG